MHIPEEMTQAGHRAAVWGALARVLRMFLRKDEATRNFFAPRAIRKCSRVSDQALRHVLEIVVAHETRELAAVNRWKLVRIVPEDPGEDPGNGLPPPYARTGT
jgi:hypothetical protein